MKSPVASRLKHPFAELVSVRCLSSNSCWAVGVTQRGTPLVQQTALVERWDGKNWSAVSVPPTPSNEIADELDEVSCTSTDFCLAVGGYSKGPTSQLAITGSGALALSWDGSAWRRVAAPANDGYAYSGLTSVTCFTREYCLGIDSRETAQRSGARSLDTIEVWNDRTWARLDQPR